MLNKDVVLQLLDTLIKQQRKGNVFFKRNIMRSEMNGFQIKERIKTKHFEYEYISYLFIGEGYLTVSKHATLKQNKITISENVFNHSCLIAGEVKSKLNELIINYIKEKSKSDYLLIKIYDKISFIFRFRDLDITLDDFLKESYNFSQEDIEKVRQGNNMPVRSFNEQIGEDAISVLYIKYEEENNE